ncbi:MAG: bifunctional folylpolyglutamate synthase/dihydrofolate synthase [Sporomusaceae bacterium]|jgi:dihydrofolate synthase/folylpolyglutamate synthase|nr:bifunctional folylpolyglutamate synthase/dihydrofolate synthase [Sporomusaceae bacterium]
MNYAQSLEYLASLNQFGMNFGLVRIEKLLELMQHPERRFKSIHITGSNGKGSTAAMLAAILSESGIRTGLYTSPHLEDYPERMTINGAQITRAEFANAIHYTKQFVDQMLLTGHEQPTEFEIITAAAFYYFAAHGAEYVVVEAGLGGLLDSTNVVLPQIAVITNVVLEHTDRCGDTVEEIAAHKAGIIKKNIPVVTAAKGAALDVIRAKARETESEIFVYQEHFSGRFHDTPKGERQKISVTSQKFGAIDAELNLFGLHQLENCSVAVATALRLSVAEKSITPETIAAALKIVTWPGRFEIAPGQPLIIIDGAHNPDGARVLRENLDHYFPNQPIVFALGILRDKDIEGIASILIRPADKVVTIKSTYYRAATAEEIAERIAKFPSSIEAAPSIAAGVARAKEIAGLDGIVCIAGSLYQLGDARAAVYKK